MTPSLFLAHGSPMLAIEESEYTRFLADYAAGLAPEAIVVFTAHWESELLTITSTDEVYETIHDFGGFPPELYQIAYAAKGSKELAARLEQRFKKQGIRASLNTSRGLDHGTWTLLHRMYPQANVPVVQISVHPFLSPKEQFAIGKSLRDLGEENILIIGSGVTVHNLRMIEWNRHEPSKWAVEFDDWLIDKIEKHDLDSLDRYMELAPHADRAVPRPEHFVPLFIAMGSGEKNKPTIIYRGYEYGTLSYLCFEF